MPALVPRVDVEPEQHAAQVVQPTVGPLGRGLLPGPVRQVQLDAVRVRRGLLGGSSATGSSRSSGAPVSTWLPVATSNSFTVP